MLLIVVFSKNIWLFWMRNGIRTSLLGIALAAFPISDAKAEISLGKNNLELSEGKTRNNLFKNLNEENTSEISLQGAIESESLYPINEKIVIKATLDYFDEQVHLYSLKGEARENVQIILNDYLSVHPILKKDSKGNMVFRIDNTPEFANMIKNLANTLFDGMPKVIREIAIFLVFGGNKELQDTLNNLDDTVKNLSIKQYKDIVFDYFMGIVKNVASATNLRITLREYYTAVYKYYPNKNHRQILDELEKTGIFDEDIRNLEYPFKKII